jgi:hypothetical protein
MPAPLSKGHPKVTNVTPVTQTTIPLQQNGLPAVAIPGSLPLAGRAVQIGVALSLNRNDR